MKPFTVYKISISILFIICMSHFISSSKFSNFSNLSLKSKTNRHTSKNSSKRKSITLSLFGSLSSLGRSSFEARGVATLIIMCLYVLYFLVILMISFVTLLIDGVIWIFKKIKSLFTKNKQTENRRKKRLSSTFNSKFSKNEESSAASDLSPKTPYIFKIEKYKNNKKIISYFTNTISEAKSEKYKDENFNIEKNDFLSALGIKAAFATFITDVYPENKANINNGSYLAEISKEAKTLEGYKIDNTIIITVLNKVFETENLEISKYVYEIIKEAGCKKIPLNYNDEPIEGNEIEILNRYKDDKNLIKSLESKEGAIKEAT